MCAACSPSTCAVMRTDHSCEAIGVCRESVHRWDSSSTHFIGGSALNVIRHLQRDHKELPQRWEWPPVCIKKDIQPCTYFSYCFQNGYGDTHCALPIYTPGVPWSCRCPAEISRVRVGCWGDPRPSQPLVTPCVVTEPRGAPGTLWLTVSADPSMPCWALSVDHFPASPDRAAAFRLKH